MEGLAEVLAPLIELCVQMLGSPLFGLVAEEQDFRIRHVWEDEDDARRELLWQRHLERSSRRTFGEGLADSSERSSVSTEARSLSPY